MLTDKKSVDGEGLDCDTLNSIIRGVTIETKKLDATPDELQGLSREDQSPISEGIRGGISSSNLNLKKLQDHHS